jgi:transposase
MRILMMNKIRRGRGSKYTDDFKRQLVTESRTAGVSVPMVAKKHGVGTNRIYACAAMSALIMRWDIIFL